MKKFTLVILFFISCSAHAGSNSVLRGYTQINRLIHERIAQRNGFHVGQYLLGQSTSSPQNGDLLSLLGTYDGSDTSAAYANGDPNTVNMLLWYIDLNMFAEDIALQCAPPAHEEILLQDDPKVFPLKLNPDFMAVLQPLCAWPNDAAKTDAVLYAFWSAILGFDAPPEEFQAWKTYFLTDPEYTTASPAKLIAAMSLSAMFNPYFLLAE